MASSITGSTSPKAFQLFTTVQRLKIPSKMLYFPDEGHWVLKPQNSRLWYQDGERLGGSVDEAGEVGLFSVASADQGAPNTRKYSFSRADRFAGGCDWTQS